MFHDQRIAATTGQAFGTPYFDGLLKDTTAVLDSAPPITAVLTADQMAGNGLDMLARLQKAHYLEGRRIAEHAVLQDLATEMGMDREGFAATFAQLEGTATGAHVAESRRLMDRVGGQGFPTFALEAGGRLLPVQISAYWGQPEAWQAWLTEQVARHSTVEPGPAPAFCGLDGCGT